MTTFDLNAGALAPVDAEVTLRGAGGANDQITVDGAIPDDLNGLLIRNGPNPRSGRFDGDSMLDWWVGDGMVHGLAIAEGAVTWFRNRWTTNLSGKTNNVNVVGFGGKILVLGEGEVPTEIDAELHPLGPTTFGGALPNGITAHPKVDPKTGLLRFFRADWQPPFLQVGAIDQNHQVVELREVEVDRPVLMHDFAITERFDIALHLNVTLDLKLATGGARLPLRWDPDHHTRLAAIPRDGSPTHWFDITPCFIQHVVNAFEDPARPNTVILDAVRYDRFLCFDEATEQHLPNPLGVLWRYELDIDRGTVTEHQLDDRFIELPRIDERFTGGPYTHLYAVEQPTDTEMRGLRRYDLRAGRSQTFAVAPGDQNSEPIFVPQRAGGGADEGDGWLLCCLYRAASDTTDVAILRATDIDQPPVATIHLPRRIPAGFHGAWVPLPS
ncbi:MAG: carotenoid oxygenase family protein [Acidimicrobiales bacterium]